MINKALTSLAFAAGCAIALAVPAVQAQTADTQILMNTPRLNAGDNDGSLGRNNAENAQYDRLLQTDPAFRHSRMIRECGSITIAHLRAGCMESFAIDEDRRSMGWRYGLTGDSHGRMNPIDRTFQGPEMYDPRFGR